MPLMHSLSLTAMDFILLSGFAQDKTSSPYEPVFSDENARQVLFATHIYTYIYINGIYIYIYRHIIKI